MNPNRAKRFQFIDEDKPSVKWLAFYNEAKGSYKQWFLKEGELNRPSFMSCKNALQEHMPELLPLWEHLLALTKADDIDARLLSFYCPTPYVSGGSQAVWMRYNPVLVKNFDNSPELFEARILKSCWDQTQVIASTDGLWGVLDGMNEHGLSVSWSFGGRSRTGKGFSISIILRYILEYCKTTEEAVAVLRRIPVNLTYNVTLLDANFNIKTVELSPFIAPIVSHIPLAVNHQGGFELSNYAMFSNSHERKQELIEKLYDPLVTIDSFINAFEYAPLFSTDYDHGLGTLYTAIYNPQLKAMEFRWPYYIKQYQSFNNFEEKELWITY
ncbi:C45 family autoproteolytic acyltransferase/hydolase [Shewanella surugensis]|uniref:C45 family autoproteolytic acyltransferase/hydrolase n=1 Tax=Shewanella surugensis TaxID=212020 RepID=A0ABT0LCB2_9GAMM|nr:C45 family peptidase [Shewanella surugensis]MCL1125342.1 C45 family autoproteolytic acyltransferase/hydrolase [Shewanella surugensis]